MTDITKHVTSLQLSRELKQIGVPQISYFYWVKGNSEYESEWRVEHDVRGNEIYNTFFIKYSAFLASELWEILPHSLEDDYYLEIWKRQPYNAASYRLHGMKELLCEVQGPRGNLSETLGRTVLYLIKEGLIDVTSLGILNYQILAE